MLEIRYCPLREQLRFSRRDQWFEQLDVRGVDPEDAPDGLKELRMMVMRRQGHDVLQARTQRCIQSVPRQSRTQATSVCDASTVSDDATDNASERHDEAEHAYMSAVASGADDCTLLRLARDVAEAAQVWQTVDSDAEPPP